jgi:hypothetical protein
MRMPGTIVPLLALTLAMAACGSPTSPSPAGGRSTSTSATTLMVFTDRASGFSTTDVRDAYEQIVQFNTAGEMIWTAGDARFAGFLADDGVVTAEGVCAGCYFLIRFGTLDGQRRAYLTWSGDPAPDRPVTILDVDVVGGRLVVADSGLALPNS